jgi:ParB-like chromosome segregation protein Spo0J
MSNKQTEYEVHPAASLFPMMDAESFARLKADIKENGQEKPITFFDGKLLDGRNRMMACHDLGIEPLSEEIEDAGDGSFDPFKWVLSMNLHRRHLTESQRSMVAGKLSNLKVGQVGNGRKVEVSIETPTLEQAADMLNVGRASVARAKQVLEHGSEEIIEAVEKGDISVSLAARVATEEPDKKTQAKVYKRGGKAALKEHITEPSPYVDDKDEKAESAVGAFKKLWAKWDDTQRTAVRVWLDEHYLDSKGS